jgi:hypothetical protein
MERKLGYYAGTEIDQKWWKRYSHDGFFARGNGQYWMEDEGFFFLRILTKTPVSIPFNRMRTFTKGTWHAGRWAWGQPFVKIHWSYAGQDLSSGFVVSKSVEETEEVITELERQVAS